jgi:putative endonuclease
MIREARASRSFVREGDRFESDILHKKTVSELRSFFHLATMQYFVYIIYSINKDKYYIGQTQHVENRLSEHNINYNLGTNDWQIKYIECFETRAEAVRREREIKKKKRRSYLESLINDF